MKKSPFSLLVLYLLFSSVCFSDTIHVPADQPTIQEAISAAANGDTVLVAPGTYVENIDFLGKTIEVIGRDGAEQTFIDGGNPAHPDFGSVVSFTNGEGLGSVLEGFTLMNGTGTEFGYQPSYYRPFGGGGGIACFDSIPDILNNNLISNVAGGEYGDGGGIYCCRASPRIINNMIAMNSSPGNYGYGAGVHCYLSEPVITNNTIAMNSCAWSGGGIGCYGSAPKVTNTILWENDAVMGKEIWVSGTSADPSHFSISYSDVKDGTFSVFVDLSCTMDWGDGMIDGDPLFVDSANHDYHLTAFSPCKDNGDQSTVAHRYDFEGDPRFAHESIDMGADEFYTHLYYTGDAIPNGEIETKLVGFPHHDAFLFVGSAVFEIPHQTKFGNWYLIPPIQSLNLGPLPWSGVRVLLSRVPPGCPTPLSVPLQGLNRGKLTNLCTIDVVSP